ncbi:hypothetical protein T484DRAFT_1984270, partial [Baffinella frigidus]
MELRGAVRAAALLGGLSVAVLLLLQVAVRSGDGERAELSEGYSYSRHEYPVNKAALENYLRHTGQESKLALINPSLAKRIHSQSSFVKGGHEHEPAMRSERSYSLRALAEQKHTKRVAHEKKHTIGLSSSEPRVQLSSLQPAAAPAVSADGHLSRAELKARAQAGEQAWAKLQQLHLSNARSRQAATDFPTPVPGKAQFFEDRDGTVVEKLANGQVVYPSAPKLEQTAPVQLAAQGVKYFETPQGQVVEQLADGQMVAPQAQQAAPAAPAAPAAQPQGVKYFETPQGQVVEQLANGEMVQQQAPAVQQQQQQQQLQQQQQQQQPAAAPAQAVKYFETPQGQVMEQLADGQMVAVQQQQQAVQQPAQPAVPAQAAQAVGGVQYFEEPNGQVVEKLADGQMAAISPGAAAQRVQVTGAPAGVQGATKLSDDTDDLDGALGVVSSEPLEDPVARPENSYTVQGTSYPSRVTVGLPSAGGAYPQAQYASSAGAQLSSGGAAGGTTQLAEVSASDAGAGRTESLWGLGGQEDPLEGTWKVQGGITPIPCDGPVQHADTPLCVAKKAMAQALQAEKDVIAAHEKIATQKERLAKLDTSYRERYTAMEKRFETLVVGLRDKLREQKRRLLSEARRITTGDNLSLQKVSQARTTEMHDWTDLNRRMSELQVRLALIKKAPGPEGGPGGMGPQGFPGNPGTQGVRGPMGDPGPQGPTGQNGGNGRSGLNGRRGPAGNPINMQGYV